MQPIKLTAILLSFIFAHYHTLQKQEGYHLRKQQSALGRRKKKRIKWDEVNLRISDRHFRRMFRMSRDCFKELCSKVISYVGESSFKSESYISAFLDN